VSAYVVFFLQAEDGIRDRNVTGVQTCALPILRKWSSSMIKTIFLSAKRSSLPSSKSFTRLFSLKVVVTTILDVADINSLRSWYVCAVSSTSTDSYSE